MSEQTKATWSSKPALDDEIDGRLTMSLREGRSEAAFEKGLSAVLYEGYIDAIEGGRVYGWALDPSDKSHRISVTLFHGAQELDVVLADRFREDLVSYGDGTGKHAFVFNLDKDLWNRPAAEFHAHFTGTSVPLLRGQRATDLLDDQPPIEITQSETMPIPPDLVHMVARIEQLERAFVGVLRLVHPNSDWIAEMAKTTDRIDRRYEETKRDMAALEGFVARMERTLKEAVAVDEQPAKQSMKTQWIVFASLVVVITAVTIGSAMGWFASW